MKITLTIDGRVTLNIDTDKLDNQHIECVDNKPTPLDLGVYTERCGYVTKKHYITEFNPQTQLYTVNSNQFQTTEYKDRAYILENYKYLEPLNGITNIAEYRRHHRNKHNIKVGTGIGPLKPRNILVTPENLNTLTYSAIKKSYDKGLIEPNTPEFKAEVLEVYRTKRNEYNFTYKKQRKLTVTTEKKTPPAYNRKQGGITPETIQLLADKQYWKMGYKTLRKLIKGGKIPESDIVTVWKCIKTQERYIRNKHRGMEYDLDVFQYCEKFWDSFRDLRSIPRPKTRTKVIKDKETQPEPEADTISSLPVETDTPTETTEAVKPEKELNFHEQKIAERQAYEKKTPLKLPEGKERQDLIEEFLKRNPDKRCKDSKYTSIVGFRID